MNHIPRNKLVLQELSKRITKHESTKQVPQSIFDIPLQQRSGRHVNRHKIVDEAVQEVALEQTLDISLPQSSGSNVMQQVVVEEPIQEEIQGVSNLVQEVAYLVVFGMKGKRKGQVQEPSQTLCVLFIGNVFGLGLGLDQVIYFVIYELGWA